MSEENDILNKFRKVSVTFIKENKAFVFSLFFTILGTIITYSFYQYDAGYLAYFNIDKSNIKIANVIRFYELIIHICFLGLILIFYYMQINSGWKTNFISLIISLGIFPISYFGISITIPILTGNYYIPFTTYIILLIFPIFMSICALISKLIIFLINKYDYPND